MTFRALCIWVASVLLTTLSGEAVAQTATPGTSIGRRDGRGALPLTKINYDDCVLEDSLQLELTLKDFTDQALKVWAGTSPNCGKQESRDSLGSQCWLVLSEETATKSVTLPVQDIVGACTGERTEGTLTLFFEMLNGDNPVTTAQPVTLGLSYDLTGPKAPAIDRVGVGETRLYPKWALSASADAQGYRIYCEPTGLSGTDEDSACSSSVLMEGKVPSTDLVVRGTAGKSATSGEADGLENYQQYACAVSAYDDSDNSGPLSAIACGEPQIVLGYFKGYRAAGGQAGGGYCAFSRVGTAGTASTALALAALALLGRRSRRAGVSR